MTRPPRSHLIARHVGYRSAMIGIPVHRCWLMLGRPRCERPSGEAQAWIDGWWQAVADRR